MTELTVGVEPRLSTVCPGVLAIGEIMPEVLARYGLLGDGPEFELESADAEFAAPSPLLSNLSMPPLG